VAFRIAIIGWGSLLWDLDDLAPHVTGGWDKRGGPRLPMEFSRISPKRRMGLVVALDPAMGRPCATHAIRSVRGDPQEARADLAHRERAAIERIGWARADGAAEGRLPAVTDAVVEWCRAAGMDAAVWTDLEPNFATVAGVPFSVAAGIDWLRGLEGASLGEAHRYIRNAPASTRTPLRRALARDPWWRGLRGADRSLS